LINEHIKSQRYVLGNGKLRYSDDFESKQTLINEMNARIDIAENHINRSIDQSKNEAIRKQIIDAKTQIDEIRNNIAKSMIFKKNSSLSEIKRIIGTISSKEKKIKNRAVIKISSELIELLENILNEPENDIRVNEEVSA